MDVDESHSEFEQNISVCQLLFMNRLIDLRLLCRRFSVLIPGESGNISHISIFDSSSTAVLSWLNALAEQWR